MAQLFRKILCPLDLDANAALTIQTAREIAARSGGKLILLHVVQTADAQDAEKQIKHLAAENLGDGVPYEIEVATGQPAPTILQAAERVQADVIVMATHGRKGVDHFLLGSVAERVLRESPVPVLTVRGGRGKHPHIPTSVVL
jgi:nucleotide-binding universal stress UspA family protein